MLVKFDIKLVLAKSTTIRQIIDNLPKYSGTSYLINYLDLKNNYIFYKQSDVKNYILLASYRDYRHSITFDNYSLDIDLSPISKEAIDNNKLIWCDNKAIFFSFEESKASTLRKRNKNGN